MNPVLARLPLWITLALVAVLVLVGPIAQPAAYHAFADDTLVMGIPRAADVLSNLGFAVVALWGFHRLRPHRNHPALAPGWAGYRLFLLGLLGTAAGSAFYHWAPDDARLVWDRLPIALACGGLLAAVASETRREADGRARAALLALAAVLSVAWWVWTGARGQGDLRPYLLLQAAPLVLVPVWQAIRPTPARDRLWFAVALLLYVLAKAAELHDHGILAFTGTLSGHTLKHLLATAAAAVLVGRLAARTRAAGTGAPARTLALALAGPAVRN